MSPNKKCFAYLYCISSGSEPHGTVHSSACVYHSVVYMCVSQCGIYMCITVRYIYIYMYHSITVDSELSDYNR